MPDLKRWRPRPPAHYTGTRGFTRFDLALGCELQDRRGSGPGCYAGAPDRDSLQGSNVFPWCSQAPVSVARGHLPANGAWLCCRDGSDGNRTRDVRRDRPSQGSPACLNVTKERGFRSCRGALGHGEDRSRVPTEFPSERSTASRGESSARAPASFRLSALVA